ncbi:MAG: (Fe-S)-binding protein [Methanohalobium sp.]|uniref:(Fe-S)-binding protein n=1 Tax=Methanohalobium sp. TaxID=2837493 RepID=UPI003978FE8B
MENYKHAVESCIDCKKCWDVCPVTKVIGNEYTPQSKIELLSKIESGEELSEKEFDDIYLSSRCGACNEVCPVDIPIKEIIQYERSLLAEQGREPDKTTYIVQSILQHNNPGGKDDSKRFDWVSDDLQIAEHSEIGYMVGCWIAHARPEIARATIRVLNAAGIEPMLMDKEKCCGLFLVDNGHFEQIKKHAKEYIDYIESLGIKKLIVSCPGCYRTINNSYPDFYREPEFDVVPAVTVFEELLDEGKIVPENKLNISAPLKDACHLRQMKDTPRKIFKQIGVETTEIFDDEIVCCGAPAGLKPNYPQTSADIAMLSVNKSKETSDLMLAYCPFCIYHISGVSENMDVNIQVKDISVLLDDAIKKSK